MTLSGRSRIVTAGKQQQASCRLGDEVVVLGLQAGVYHGLNPVAARIWELIRQPRTVNEILGVLLDEYDVDAGRCERDLLLLLQELAARDLIVVANDTPS